MKRITQTGNYTSNSMVTLEFSSPELIATKIVTWKCHVDDSTAGSYDMILSRDLLTKLGIDINISMNTIDSGKGTHQGFKTPTANLD